VASWEYEWDAENRLVKVTKMDENLDDLYSVEYKYCPGCGGSRTQRIKRDWKGAVEEWYRYEEEGLNTLRVDEAYDPEKMAGCAEHA